MKNRKMRFHFFSVPEWEKEQDYLRRQHQNGWKFVKVNGLCLFHFERCEPEDVIYQLDYNQEGKAHKEEYVQMFRDCGWEYMQDYVGYSYFRKPAAEMQSDEAIFCDDASRLDMMKRVFKGRMIPLLVIFLCCILPNIFITLSLEKHVMTGIFTLLFCLYMLIFFKFGIQFWKLQKNFHS